MQEQLPRNAMETHHIAVKMISIGVGKFYLPALRTVRAVLPLVAPIKFPPISLPTSLPYDRLCFSVVTTDSR
jgi:hypothetical protein